MLLKLSENLEKTQPLRRTYKGKVVDNADPEKLGRVKCTISGIFEGDTANLPWIFPKRSNSLGGKSDSGGYAVPEVDSYLEIVFPTQDVYSPFYVGYWEDANTHQAEFDEDYPDSYGFADSTGTKLVVNKKQESFKFEHVSGIQIEMDKDGNLTINVPKDVTETIEGKKAQTITGDKEVTAENIKQTANTEVSIESGADTKIVGGANVDIESTADTKVTAGANMDMEATALMNLKATGGINIGQGSEPVNVASTLVNVNAPTINLVGQLVNLGGGGLPIARLGDKAIGVGNLGAPVACSIIQGSNKVTSG